MAIVGDVSSNLLAAAIGGAAMWLGRAYALPVIRGRLRRLPKIDGTRWQRLANDHEPVSSILAIRQSGTKITATVSRNDARQRTFKYQGEISGHQLVLTWEDEDSPEQLIGTMVLHLSSNLTRLIGYSVYFRHSAGKVVAIERTYERML